MKQVPVPYFVELLHEAKISEWGSMGGRRKGKIGKITELIEF